MDIGPGGAVTTYSGPVQTIDGVSRPILALARAASQSKASAAVSNQALAAAVSESSARSQLSPRLIEAVAWRESRFDRGAVSAKGARGVMQLIPGTAARLGVDAGDLRANLDGGAAYLASLLRQFDGDIVLSLAAYNAGPAAVRRWGGVPPYAETRAYVAGVLDRLAKAANDSDSSWSSR